MTKAEKEVVRAAMRLATDLDRCSQWADRWDSFYTIAEKRIYPFMKACARLAKMRGKK